MQAPALCQRVSEQLGEAERGGSRSGKPACPYELRLIHFSLWLNPSTIPLLHAWVQALAIATASSASPSAKLISSLTPEAYTATFQCSNRLFPSRLREPLAKVLCQVINSGDRRVNLTYLLNEGLLVLRLRAGSTNEAKRSRSRGKDFGERHRLSGDGLSHLACQTGEALVAGSASIRYIPAPRPPHIAEQVSFIPHSTDEPNRRGKDRPGGGYGAVSDGQGAVPEKGLGTHCDC